VIQIEDEAFKKREQQS